MDFETYFVILTLMINQYELMLIVNPKELDVDEKKITEVIKKHLKEGVKILSVASLGKKQFAYPIKKEKEGVYWLFVLEIEGKEVSSVSNKLKLEASILRYLFVKKE